MRLSARSIHNMGLAAGFIILFTISGFSYLSIKELMNAFDMRKNAYEIIAGINVIQSQMIDAETGQRGFLLTGKEVYLEPYRAATPLISRTVAELSVLTANSVSQQQRLHDAEPLIADKLAELSETIDLNRTQGFDAAVKVVETDRGKKYMDSLRHIFDEMENEENAVMKRQAESIAAVSTRTGLMLLVGLFSAFAITGIGSVLLKREMRIRNMLDAERDRFFTLSIDLLCIASTDGYFKRLNPAFTSTLGYSLEELLNKPFMDFIHPDDIAKTLNETKKLASGETTLRFENRYRCKDGSYKWLSWTAAPYPSEGLMYASGRDITERKQIEVDLKQARDAALEWVRMKSEFLANMSHEIRTPINGVIGMTEMLLDTTLTSNQRECARNIQMCSDSLLTVINDILDFSKIEAGKLEFEILDFDLREAIEDTVQLFANRAQTKGLEIASFIYHDLPLLVRGDPTRLRQILTNLIGNALKFTERGEIIIRATKLTESANHVIAHFSVTDTGIGIPDALQRRLFQSFSQADGSMTRKYGGTGLGLAICKQLAELMGGEIGVESTAAKGSTFWFTARLEKQLVGLQVAPAETRGLDKLKVLIVDDNATNRTILLYQVSSWNMRADAVECGTQALAAMRRAAEIGDPFVLAILDIQMPEMDGLTLAKAISCDPALASTRLILMSSTDRTNSQIARSIGVSASLVKPVRQRDLFKCLSRMMSAVPGALAPSSALMPAVPPANEDKLASRSPVGARILVVEDNSVIRAVALNQLRKLGYTADAVASGVEALDALAKYVYAIVLMDCQMPEMDGYKVTAEIRQREGASRHTIIIAMTAHAMVGSREKCLAAGMDDFISKPVKAEDLGVMLNRWCKPTQKACISGNGATQNSDSLPVDLKQLRKVTEGAEHDLIKLYFQQTAAEIEKLKSAIKHGSARDVEHIAHNCIGGSGTFGMVAIVPLFRELECSGRDANLAGAAAVCEKVEMEFDRIKTFLGSPDGLPPYMGVPETKLAQLETK